jgi:hypothetical protein
MSAVNNPFDSSIPILSAYNPHEAENGKFVALDSSTITGYTSGSGRYAILVYNVAPERSVTPASATSRTPSISAHYTSGTISAGCFGLTFIANQSFSGTVLGMPLLAGASLTIPMTTNTGGVFAFTDDITLQPGESITLAATSSLTAVNSFTVSLNTREDQ